MKNHTLAALAVLTLTLFFSPKTEAQTIQVLHDQPRQNGDLLLVLGLKVSDLKFGQKIKVSTLCPNQGKKITAFAGKNTDEEYDNKGVFYPEKLGKPCTIFFDLSATEDNWNRKDTVNWLVQVTAGEVTQTFTGQYFWPEEETSLKIGQPKYPAEQTYYWHKDLWFPGNHTGDPVVNLEVEFDRDSDYVDLCALYSEIRCKVDDRGWTDYKWKPNSFGWGNYWKTFRVGLPNLPAQEIKKYLKDFKVAQTKGLTTPTQDQEMVLLEQKISQFYALEQQVLAGGGWLWVWRLNGEGQRYSYEYEFGPLVKKAKN